MGYIIKYKSHGKWQTHNKKYSDKPIHYKTKNSAINALKKHSFQLIYQTNPIKIVRR
jgi:hypothetical protein